ncbi:hypothetical protein C7H83_04545 [Tetragenococcus halophilus]|uniref:Uncharacterized protein n=1 Tax=Tetragenococcus halophilus TaxID=51669 RepID=A0A3G5FHK8_TETHA|nr:hypothetical protein C7H83_04545 [Tetragenococcus halophilus]
MYRRFVRKGTSSNSPLKDKQRFFYSGGTTKFILATSVIPTAIYHGEPAFTDGDPFFIDFNLFIGKFCFLTIIQRNKGRNVPVRMLEELVNRIVVKSRI